MDRFEARVSVGRTLLYFAGSVGFAAIGLWFVMRPDMLSGPDGPPWLRGAPWAVMTLGAVCILFFGMIGVIALRQLARREAVVEIDAQGIRWRRWSDAVIPWDAISELAVTQMMNQRFVSLWLVDASAYPSTHMMGNLAGANRGMGFGDIAIAPAGLDQGVEAMLAAIERFAPSRLLG